MLVIEGLNGKALEVLKEIENIDKDANILIFENVGLTLSKMIDRRKTYAYSVYDFDINRVEEVVHEIFKEKTRINFVHIIFYLNVRNKYVGFFKELEEKYGFKAILTVQTHDDDFSKSLKKYEV